MENENSKDEQAKNNLVIPAAIILAGLMIAGAVLYSGGSAGVAKKSSGNTPEVSPSASPSAENIKPVTEKDHILGNPDAAVKVIEFSDTECPFCKRFHPTMQQIINDYGKDGKVAWVYRHFPLDSIHPKARKEAEATECANELGGNAKFWAYVNRLFEVTPSNNNLDPAELPNIAEYVGLNRAEFGSCLASGKYADRVAEDLADATNSGGRGTPYSVVIAANGKKFEISGAQPYAAVKSVVELALKEK